MGGNEWGAVDLSGMAPPEAGQQEGLVSPTAGAGHAPAAAFPQAPAAPSAAGEASVLIDAPLVTDVTDTTFDQQMALSTSVPVVLVLYSPTSLASKQALQTLESVVRKDAGRFQLGRVNVDQSPQIAAAFQAQAIPSGYAVLAHRPVPLFEGAPTETQINQVLDELLEVAPQMGVVGRLNVADTELETPMPAAHRPARTAEMEGEWDKAIAAWKKVLASNPSDLEAKQALARAKFEQRLEQENEAGETDLTSSADAMFAAGDEQGAFTLLLDALQAASTGEEKEEIRQQLVGLFQIATDHPAVKAARRQLATYLMV